MSSNVCHLPICLLLVILIVLILVSGTLGTARGASCSTSMTRTTTARGCPIQTVRIAEY
ncbi:hypothetical protein ACP4OV_030667 [Aristida adscensionis]